MYINQCKDETKMVIISGKKTFLSRARNSWDSNYN